MSRRSVAQVVVLLLLAPVCAEYLSAYDDSTGHPAALIGNLVVFVPLYGGPALLVRELARRSGLGWVGILLLGTAFGLVQAGLVDQSLFSVDYRDLAGWEATYAATLITPWGVSAFNLVNFVSGHLIFAIAAPIALVEAARPRTGTTPWLPKPALAVVGLAWVGASLLVMTDVTAGESASATQLAVTVALVVVLVLAAFLRPVLQLRRESRTTTRTTSGTTSGTTTRPAPGTLTVGLLALLLAVCYGFAPETWVGVVVATVVLIIAFVGLGYASARPGWSPRHVAVVAAAPLVVRAVLAFGYDPMIGEVSAAGKCGHNVAMLLIVLAVAVWALRPARTHVRAAERVRDR
jgi:hypothetical protein